MLLGQPTEIAVLDFDDFKKKAAQEERSEAQSRGAIPLLKKDRETVQEMVEKARAKLATSEHAAIRSIVELGDAIAYNEVTAVWKDRCGDRWPASAWIG